MTSYHRPATLAGAFRLKAEHAGSRYLAGGSDLIVRMREGREAPGAIISLRDVPGLAGISDFGDIRIGGLTTVADIAAHPVVREVLPALAEAARVLGSAQIRNVATLGGNLANASPCADLAPPLLVLEATCQAEGPGGRREFPVEALFTGPGRTCLDPAEVLTAVVVRRPAHGTRSTYLKKGRVAMDLAQASVAALLELDGPRCRAARLAAGAVAPRPLRLRGAEEVLAGRELTGALVAEAAAIAEREIQPISDLRATAEYRRALTGALVRRGLARLAGLAPEAAS